MSVPAGVACRREQKGACVGKTKRGNGSKALILADGGGPPLAAEVHSASPGEVHPIEPLRAKRVLRRRPKRLIYEPAETHAAEAPGRVPH